MADFETFTNISAGGRLVYANRHVKSHGDPRGIARFCPGFGDGDVAGGFAGGFAGDSWGIRSPFGGFAMSRGVFSPRFGGIRVRPRQAFIILKRVGR